MLPALPDGITEEAANQYIFGKGDDSLCGDNRKTKADNKRTDNAESERKKQRTSREKEKREFKSTNDKKSSTK